MKKLAMFDLDGTLYDTRDVNFYSYKKALEEFGFSLNYKYFTDYCNGKHYSNFLPNIMNGIEQIEKVHNLKKRYYTEYLDEAKENEYLFDIIKGIKSQYYIALVTTASRKNCKEILEHYGRLHDFDYIVAQEDVKNKKPDPEGYFKAMRYFDVSNKESFIFEDSEVGIEAAKRSGATVFVVKGFS